MATDKYINHVLHHLPHATPLRAQIAAELRAMPDAVLGHLGDPAALAASYLAAVPLVRAPIWRRFAAKFVDVALLLFVIVPMVWVIGIAIVARMDVGDQSSAGRLLVVVCVLALILTSILFSVYTAIAEYTFGATVGKRVLRMQVVRENGARIGVGQALVRQLAGVFQVTAVDALFALFTEKHQRAFELLSKTRVVMAG